MCCISHDKIFFKNNDTASQGSVFIVIVQTELCKMILIVLDIRPIQ